MRKPLLISAALHIGIMLFAYFGLFRFEKNNLDIAQPIPVDVVNVAEKATSPNPLKEALKTEEPEEKVKEPKPAPKEEPKPEPEVKEEPKPDPKPEPLPEPIKDEAKPEDAVIPEKKKEEKPKEKPQEKPKPKKEKKPEDKKEKPKDKPKKEKPQDSFASVLKNLDTMKAKSKGTSKNSTILDSEGMGGELGDVVAASELDRVRKQIEEAWTLPAGAQNVDKMTVRIQISVNADRTVRDAKLVKSSLTKDPAYSILAESALRAVLSFRDTPLLLPPGKHNVWKELTINFDPRNVL